MTIEAIKAVVDLIEMGGVVGQKDIVKCLRSAIEQADRQEPVAWGYMHNGVVYDCICPAEHERVAGEYTVPLYTAPPQQEKQEPVAWGYRSKRGQIIDCIAPEDHGPTTKEFNVPLYAAPPQRQPLTNETLWEMWVESPSDVLQFARIIERAHGIGGGE